MKVTNVEIYAISPPGPPGPVPWHPVIVRVNTDSGLSGLGEVGLAYGTGYLAAVGMVHQLAEQYLLGADPMNIEQLYETMLRRSFWGLGGGPVVYGGISALDTALWDIKGQALSIPVYQLLGGRTNDRLRTYASQIQGGWSDQPQRHVAPEEFAEAARAAVAEGYTAVKVDPCSRDARGQPVSSLRGVLSLELVHIFYDRVKAIRDAVGSSVDILLEAHGNFSITSAIQMGRAWEELGCFCYEEPIDSMNVPGMAKVARAVNIPLAAGERIYTRWGYRPYLEQQILDIAQPDIGLAGGISETKKIADIAAAYDVTVQCHVCGSAVATAAALHLETAIPNFIIHEHHLYALQAANQAVIQQPLQPEQGYFRVSNAPGLGIDLNSEFMAPHLCQVVSA